MGLYEVESEIQRGMYYRSSLQHHRHTVLGTVIRGADRILSSQAYSYEKYMIAMQVKSQRVIFNAMGASFTRISVGFSPSSLTSTRNKYLNIPNKTKTVVKMRYSEPNTAIVFSAIVYNEYDNTIPVVEIINNASRKGILYSFSTLRGDSMFCFVTITSSERRFEIARNSDKNRVVITIQCDMVTWIASAPAKTRNIKPAAMTKISRMTTFLSRKE